MNGAQLSDRIATWLADEWDRRFIPAPHGVYSTYVNHRCRCTLCKAANTARSERLRRARGAPPRAVFLASLERTHGRIATYNDGCRCDDCRRAAREYRALMRANAKVRQS